MFVLAKVMRDQVGSDAIISSLKSVDVAAIIEGQRISRFLLGLITLSWIVTFVDGLDSNLISFAASYIKTDFRLTTTQTGTLFAIHQVGAIVGGIFLGALADRVGRRPTTIVAMTSVGALTICLVFCDDYHWLFVLRLFDGIPLGGMLPLAWALNIEFAPKKYRATIVTVIMAGYSLGTAIGAPLANRIIPMLGWRSIFIIGGVVAFAASLMLSLFLPESVRFLVATGRSSNKIASIINRFSAVRVPPDAVFVASDEERAATFMLSQLFRGQLIWITPLIWMAYIASSFAVFFIVNWTPMLFEALYYKRTEANNIAGISSLLGAVGGLLLMRFTDTRGSIAITPVPVIASTLLLIAGLGTLKHHVFGLVVSVIGGSLITGHFGMHSICGLFYPSAFRAHGAGWATSVAKIGSVLGPAAGGWILATNVPIRNIYAVLAICPAIFSICIYLAGRIERSASQDKSRA
jgi:AAHS family 4-hydroxybenzoate transporter-like MFS transporter